MEEAGRSCRVEREDQQRGRVAAVVVGAGGGGEIEIELEVEAAATAASSSGQQQHDAEAGLRQARKMELIGVIFILIMAACFFVELSGAKPPMGEVIQGLFIPRLRGAYATSDAIAVFSALIVPHNLFLHPSLVLLRKIPSSPKGIKDTYAFLLIENAFALFLVLLVNVAIVSITGTICADSQLVDNISICSGLTLNSTSVLLKNMFGRSSSKIFGLALLASGQSCTVATSYSGQYIMQIVRVAWILSMVIMGINIYFFCTSFISWLVDSELPRIVKAIISTLVFPFMAAYIAALIYLVFKKVSVSGPFPSMSISTETEVEVRRQDDKVDDITVC
ncbi:Metal transporter Nramp4 [Dichanthelium oligosanthes]|uniref:Metal transporter Nramp4 n=1 Tax=Dichanthelium oligosanthes TaxID=888268 RepID=A0A1E5UV11_9POAL|nr:Metal transporter Nramp4 [Dichanthelium oligosanthes]